MGLPSVGNVDVVSVICVASSSLPMNNGQSKCLGCGSDDARHLLEPEHFPEVEEYLCDWCVGMLDGLKIRAP